MLGINTQPTPMVDNSAAVTAPIKRVKRPEPSPRPMVTDLDVLVMGRYAHLTGVVPAISDDGNGIEYRVLVGQGDASTPVSSDLPDRIVGAGDEDDRALLAPTRVGRIERTSPFYSLDVIITDQHLTDTDGWLNMRRAVESCVADDEQLALEDVDDLDWIADGPLLTLDIGHLDPCVEWLVVRFEAREVLDRDMDGGVVESRPLQGSGRTFMVPIDPEARHGRFVTIPTR